MAAIAVDGQGAIADDNSAARAGADEMPALLALLDGALGVGQPEGGGHRIEGEVDRHAGMLAPDPPPRRRRAELASADSPDRGLVVDARFDRLAGHVVAEVEADAEKGIVLHAFAAAVHEMAV